MPHFAPRTSLGLAVKVEFYVRDLNCSRPIWFAVRPGIAKEVRHRCRPVEFGRPERQPANRPKLLLADEPTGSLDTESGDSVIELMFELNRSFGTTLVMVTHDEHLAGRCARAVRLSGGRIVS